MTPPCTRSDMACLKRARVDATQCNDKNKCVAFQRRDDSNVKALYMKHCNNPTHNLIEKCTT